MFFLQTRENHLIFNVTQKFLKNTLGGQKNKDTNS